MHDADAVAELLADCHDDPGLFHEAILGRPPLHDKQELIGRSVLRNRITVVPAGHAVGKSWYAATAILQWLFTRPDSKVITTSASNAQLVSVLWGAVKTAFARSKIKLPGRISEGNATPQRLELAPEWYAIGFSAKKSENFAGFHGDNILVVVDESSGVDQPIWDAIEGLGYTSLLALGNPLRGSGHFKALYELAAAGAPGYAGFRLTAFDSPLAALTDEQVRAAGLKPGLTTKTWIDRIRRLYGEASLYWRTRVLALFPDEDFDQLLPTEWVERAFNAVRPQGIYAGPRRLSLDLSKGTGRDRAAAMVADDLGLLELVADPHLNLVALANLARRLSARWGVAHDQITYDAGGWAGNDMARHLEALGIEDAVPYYGSGKGGARRKNKRTRSAWTLRQRLDPDRERILPPPARQIAEDGPPQIINVRRAAPNPIAAKQPAFCLPAAVVGAHADDLRQELVALRYTHGGAKIELEPKAAMAQRLGRSPDLADTLIMNASLWEPD
jgi:hypothetical protein